MRKPPRRVTGPRAHPLRAAIAALLLGVWSPFAVHALTWRQAVQEDADWFDTEAGRRVVDNVLFYQYPSGGWPKNIDMAAPLDDAGRRAFARAPVQAIIDNGATYTQIRFLARAFRATGDPRARDAALRGIEFLLEAQYDNGGWPMIYPLRRGYYSHITFNDEAMAGVLSVLREVALQRTPFTFVDDTSVERARQAVDTGIACILDCQVVVDGRKTVWCAQHDEITLAPAPARSYEVVSLSGQESAGLVEFLMSLDGPSPEVMAAVHAAVDWFEATKIEGIRLRRGRGPDGKGPRVMADPEAPPIWARFYEIGTNRPIFTGRDGVVHDTYGALELERRQNYGYYGYRPAAVLDAYPGWAARWGTRNRP